ncbi:RNA-directed DNA polymerase from mobile element jockey [Plakobranchus ocellatus]|uniref:RNA-directed DNA polymerase from mobile element jockey n=1 Tax=Plakobranchus ocellatus TaxID=259542 RepID=A0AAV4CDK3_9GAST|nr:RNA-directed DNA polymerase from mobile element jockey [Plakobranchus ocellatus]
MVKSRKVGVGQPDILVIGQLFKCAGLRILTIWHNGQGNPPSMGIAPQLQSTAENIKDIFYDTRGPPPTIERTVEGPAILKEEEKHVLSKIKQRKATGPDNIPVEAIKALEDFGITEVTNLMNTMYNTGELPKDMRKSMFITLPKQPRTTERDQQRKISLMNPLTKILLRIVMKRVRNN